MGIDAKISLARVVTLTNPYPLCSRQWPSLGAMEPGEKGVLSDLRGLLGFQGKQNNEQSLRSEVSY